MRSIVLVLALAAAVPALAADLGRPVLPPAPPAPVTMPAIHNWTGYFVGAHGGAVFDGGAGLTYAAAGNFENTGTRKAADMDTKDMLAGIHGGYRYQMNQIVVGIEGSASFGKLKGTHKENAPPVGNDYITNGEIGPLYMGTAILGYAMDRALIYGKAGYAMADVKFDASFHNKDGIGGTNGTLVKISNTFDRSGFVYGGGIEYAITNNISLGVEYLHVDLGKSNVATVKTTNSGITTEKVTGDAAIETVTARVNFKF